MTYCSTNFIRTIVDIDGDVGDGDLSDLRDDVAVPELNQDIHIYIDDEEVEHIDGIKTNVTDGSNKTFYAKDVHENHKHLGDRNDDATVDGSDIDAYVVRGNSRISNLSVTVVDASTGELEIEDASGNALESGDQLYISYAVAPVNVTSPHPLVKVACAQLAAAYSFTKVDAQKHESFDVGDVSVDGRSNSDMDMRQQYADTVHKITQREQIASGPNENTMESLDIPDDIEP